MTLRLWKALKARMAAEHVASVYETLERPLVSVLGRMEGRGISIDRQVLSRLSGEFGQKQAGLEDEISKLAGQPLNPAVRSNWATCCSARWGLRGGTKTKTGQWATGARALEELAEQGHELPRKSWTGGRCQAALDLHRRIAGLRQRRDPPRPYLLRAGGDDDRPAVVIRAESAEHPGSHRRGPKNPPRLHRRTGHQARLRRLFADRAAAPGRGRRSAGAAQGVPRRARHPRHDRVGNVRRADQGHAGEVRRRAKAINFGIIYGISAFGLANQLAIPREEPAPTSRNTSSASPASATTWKRPRPSPRRTAMC